MNVSRRELVRVGALSALFPRLAAADEPPAPKYRLAMNLELMFPRAMPYEVRLEEAAKCGAKHYGFWGHAGKKIDALLKVQEKHGMTCASISGSPGTGGSTGLTRAIPYCA